MNHTDYITQALIEDENMPADIAALYPSASKIAAAADAAVKLVQAGILPADSEVTWDMLDLSDRQRQTLRREAQKARAQARIDQLRIRTGQIEGAKDGTEQPEPFAGTTPTSGAAARPSV